MSEDDDTLQITPSSSTTKTPKKPRVKKELTPDYVSNLKKGRELLLIKKAEQRLKLEEEAVNAKVNELRKLKSEPVPEPPAPPVPVPVPEPVPEPVVAAPVKAKAQRKPRQPREPKERVVERIVEVEKIVYQAPKLNFCFV